MQTPERRAEYNKEYAKKHKARINETRRLNYRKNKEKIRAYHKAYYEKHREHLVAYARGWRKANPESCNEYNKRWRRKAGGMANINKKKRYDDVRKRLLEALGNKCCRCGFSDPRALHVDHINGGGGKLRRGKATITFFKEMLNDLSGLQLLCANCNSIKKYENKEFRAPKKQ